jgi:hypothetical protein
MEMRQLTAWKGLVQTIAANEAAALRELESWNVTNLHLQHLVSLCAADVQKL